MSERSPFTPADERLKNWDASRAAHEAQQYEAEMYGEAGKTDFSDQAKQRLEEASDYEAHLQRMQERGDNYDSFEATLDAAENNEHQDSIDRAIAADPALRRMQRMAREVADLYATEVTAENEKKVSRRLKDKEDKLEELLISFNETSSLSADEKDDIIRRIIDSSDTTEAATPAMEASTESTDDDATESDGEQASDDEVTDTPEADAADADDSESQPEAYDHKADIEATKQKLNDAADKKAEQAIDDIMSSDEAKADRELLEPVSLEGLEDESESGEEGEESEDGDAEDSIETVSEAGLEDAETEEADENGAEQDTEQRKKGAVRKFFGTLNKWFDKAAVGTGYGLTVASQKLLKRGGRKEEESDEEFEARKRKYGRTAIIGGVAVAGTMLALRLAGAELDDGNAGGSVAEAAEQGAQGAGAGGGGPEGGDMLTFSADAKRVDNGEGLYQTFKEMGIPKQYRAEVLAEAGPKLVRMGEAYPDSSPQIGGYGLNGDGHLSRRALRVIHETYESIKNK